MQPEIIFSIMQKVVDWQQGFSLQNLDTSVQKILVLLISISQNY